MNENYEMITTMIKTIIIAKIEIKLNEDNNENNDSKNNNNNDNNNNNNIII